MVKVQVVSRYKVIMEDRLMSIMKVYIRGDVMILRYLQVRNACLIALFNNINKTRGENLRKLIV